MRQYSVMVTLGKAYDGISLRNNQFMEVIPAPLNIGSIMIQADNPEDARRKTLDLLKSKRI